MYVINNSDITNDKKTKALHKLQYASFFVSSYRNSIKKAESGNIRISIMAAKNIVEDASSGLISVLTNRINIHEDYLIQSFKHLFYQFDYLYGLLKLAWPIEYRAALHLADADKKMIEITQSEINNFDEARETISILESQYPRRLMACLRIFVSQRLVKSSARILLIDVSKTESLQIKRSITFPPEFKQAGISILSYFNQVLIKKYPHMRVGVTIEQTGDKVTLIINTPEGEKERIEKELNDYGLVVTGELSPSKYFDVPYDAMALKQKLEIALLEVRQTKDLLYAERKHYEARIDNLENQTKMNHEQLLLLHNILDKEKYSTLELIKTLKEVNYQTTKAAENSLAIIIEALRKGITESDKEFVMLQLETIKKEDKSLFDKIEELLIMGAIQGTAGNYLYSWLQALSRCF